MAGTPGQEPPASGEPVEAAPAENEQPTRVLPAPASGAVVHEPAVVEQGPGGSADEQPVPDTAPRFRARTRMRRRLRHLRRLRELALRDLGGLVFDLHRFGRDRPDLVGQKLEALTLIETELEALEEALDDRRDVTELREVGIAGCSRCEALVDSSANFCSNCGTPLSWASARESPATAAPDGSGGPGPASA